METEIPGKSLGAQGVVLTVAKGLPWKWAPPPGTQCPQLLRVRSVSPSRAACFLSVRIEEWLRVCTEEPDRLGPNPAPLHFLSRLPAPSVLTSLHLSDGSDNSMDLTEVLTGEFMCVKCLERGLSQGTPHD